MSIRRAELPSDHFTQVSNKWVRDVRLSWKARGLLVWLTSHAVGFKVSEKTIIGAAPDGRDAVRAAVKELESNGYLVRERQRLSGGKLGSVDYILCDPWSAGNIEVEPKDGKSVTGKSAPTPENPSQAPTSNNTKNPQVETNDGKTNAGKSAPIRRTEDQEDQTTKKTNDRPLLSVGELQDRNARAAATAPSANSEDLSRLAGDVLGQMPDHYRSAPAWLRARMLTRITDVLHEHSPMAVVEYSHKFAGDPSFGDYEHIRRFADVIRKLEADITDGTACAGCGRSPEHPFCTADERNGHV